MSEEIKDLMVMKEEIELVEIEEKNAVQEALLISSLKEEKKEEEETLVKTEEKRHGRRERKRFNPVPKENRNYFKYENGRVIHMEPNKEKSKEKSKEKFWEKLLVKEEVGEDGVQKKNPRVTNQTVIGLGMGILFLAVMMLVYLTMHSILAKEDKIYFPADTPDVAIETPGEIQSPGKTESPEQVEAVAGDFSSITQNLKELNTSERERVKDYLKGKANRVAVISHIEKSLSTKEKYYAQIENNPDYKDTESFIVNSVAMSQEFLSAFQERSVNRALETVLDRYK